MKIILASGSPRRIEMLKENGINPIIMPPDIDECLPKEIAKEQAVLFLSLKKALFVESTLPMDGTYDDHIIIAADTIVYKDFIIGKPADKEDARRILTHLKNDTHFVVTGVCLLKPHTAVRQVFYDVTKVYFKDYTDEELERYISTDEPYDKAGGYAIQGTFGKYVDRIEGDLSNVIGFPWPKIKKALDEMALGVYC